MKHERAAHLLLVDDDKILRAMTAKTLQHAGFEVSQAGSGEDALVQFAQRPCDLILLDLMMPGLDGFEVCRRIRAMDAGTEVPILILTGLDDTEAIDLAYRHGATDFITKPINWTLLSHRVRYALRAGAAADAVRRTRESLERAQSLANMGSWLVFSNGPAECSAELLRIYGMPADVDMHNFGDTALAFVVASDRERVAGARLLMAQKGVPYQLEFEITRSDGVIRTLFEQGASVHDAHTRWSSYQGITQDITERVQAAQRIRQLADTDEVTGLPNRQFFATLAGPSLERARRQGSACAVLHVDIDRFMGVNDAFGRARGDEVLRAIAGRLQSSIRGSDLSTAGQATAENAMVARVGANAFTLLIADLASQEQAAAVALRLLAAIAQPIVVDSQSLFLTASIGIALFPGDATDIAGLTRCAEQAVHAAKSAGRAQHRFFDEQMNAKAAGRMLLEAELHRAIDEGELRLHYQPKIDASTGCIVGAEALVRWQHVTRGLVPPDEFISLAEETGLILSLTDWVLETACRSLRDWADAGLPMRPLSVNLSASSLADTSIVGKLDALMQRFNLAPASLTLEMTETMLMRDVESGVAMMQTLRARGFGLSLDDFGTGYSSLSYLRRLPLDELKIDRAFVRDAALGGRDGALAAAIIALGRELGLQMVAEGVETPEQSAFLLRRGCNVQQGYLFSRPVPLEDFERLLRVGVIRPGGIDAMGAVPPVPPTRIAA